MKLDKIITLANSNVRLRFLALERSLRSVGCNLPLWVIPYDNDKFELPANCIWWEIPEILQWLNDVHAHPMMRKYQCLTTSNYQFVDSDVIFLENPENALQDTVGFVPSCGHWRYPGHTYTKESLKHLNNKSTLWEKFIFSAGQFACDTSLYTVGDLMKTAEEKDFKYTCLLFPYHDQPGMNYLVNASSIAINNLTLPPYNMESTWAGDYGDKHYDKFWKGNKKPYLIHWAGCPMDGIRPLDKLFFNHLTLEEKNEWDTKVKALRGKQSTLGNFFLDVLCRLKKSWKAFKE